MISYCKNFIDILKYRAERQPEETAYIFLKDGEKEEDRLTYYELEVKARAVASLLSERMNPGDRALLLYPPGLEFTVAYFACLYAGIIAITAYPPEQNKNLRRLQIILDDADTNKILTTRKMHEKIQNQLIKEGLNHWDILFTDSIEGDSYSFNEITITDDTIAFLQYTSGSTNNPKGVLVSHGNLMHNTEMLIETLNLKPSDKWVSWLPVFHDMGLIAGMLTPFVGGFPSIMMAPADFIRNPLLWLKAISKYQATISGGPNFAYKYCVRKIEEDSISNLDLSHWNVAINAAEPINYDTINEFTQKFKSGGFKPEAFWPCYGLAEATLFVTGGDKNSLPSVQYIDKNAYLNGKIESSSTPNSFKIVGCGSSQKEQQVLIVNPVTLERCNQYDIGEVWIAGKSVAKGYWKQSTDTKLTFHAFTQDKQGPYLRTGDLGYLSVDDELFITGRKKDLLIFRGRNFYPQDIEYTVELSCSEIRPGCVAAFSIDVLGEEGLIIVCEVRKENNIQNETVHSILSNIAQEHGLTPDAIVFIKQGTISKTSSGKIQRSLCKKRFLSGTLKIVHQWNSKKLIDQYNMDSQVLDKIIYTKKTIHEWLKNYLIENLRVSPREIKDNLSFSYYGMDSVEAVTLVGELSKWMDLELSPILLWDYPTPVQLADYLSGYLGGDKNG